MSESPGASQRNCSHRFVSRYSNIFVWSHQAPKNSEQEWVSQTSLGYEEQKSVETLFHGGGGYNDFNVCLPGAAFKGGVCLVAAPCSNQTECSSECLNEFTPRATRVIIHNGGGITPWICAIMCPWDKETRKEGGSECSRKVAYSSWHEHGGLLTQAKQNWHFGSWLMNWISLKFGRWGEVRRSHPHIRVT